MTDLNTSGKRLNTYDFVRKTGRDLYFEARDREIEMLKDPTGGILAEFADPVNACPVCGMKEFEFMFKKQGFKIMRCATDDRCDHVFANPQINEKQLIKAYQGSGQCDRNNISANDIWIDVLLSETNKRYDSIKYQKGLTAIDKALKTITKVNPVLLDIGCSIGHFLVVARESGWNTLGLELNEKATAYARDVFGLDVRSQLLEEASFPDASFDAVTLWGVIEHLKHPVDTLKQIFKILKPGGVLLTFCPNVSSIVCRVLREKAATFDGRNHPSYFSPKSIRLAMELAGFENIAITFHQANVDAVINHLDWKDPYIKKTSSTGALRNIFPHHLKEQMEDFILKNGLGYKMMTINTKT